MRYNCTTHVNVCDATEWGGQDSTYTTKASVPADEMLGRNGHDPVQKSAQLSNSQDPATTTARTCRAAIMLTLMIDRSDSLGVVPHGA